MRGLAIYIYRGSVCDVYMCLGNGSVDGWGVGLI